MRDAQDEEAATMVGLMTLGSWGFLGDVQVCKWMVDKK